MSGGLLAVHGHFYQPDRRDPFSGRIPIEPTAAPHPHWTARVTAESYAPNVERGNFGRIGWDVGPALASWLRSERPDIHDGIVASDDGHNGLAQAYHHAILPLASARDRRTEIRWGMRDFERRIGRPSQGIWLPETAVDLLTLRICAEEGVRYTILAPWQAAVSGAVETRRPYRVAVGGGLEIAVWLFDGPLSAAVSFDPSATADADRFAQERLLPGLAEPLADGSLPVTLLATDGEFYGHHQPFRELFLEQLTTRAIRDGVTTVGALLASPAEAARQTIAIRERTSWSCHHGVLRWSAECPDAADGRWKGPLRAAFERLAGALDALTAAEGDRLGVDVWAARDGYADVASEFEPAGSYVERVLAAAQPGSGAAARLEPLLAAQASRLAMFASDGWFWDDPARVETAQVLRFAAHASRTIDALTGSRTEAALVADLASLRSVTTGQDGAELYRAALAAVDQPPPAG